MMASKGRERCLDGLRGVAALVVFGTHLSLIVFPALHNGISAMSRLGWEWHLAGTPLGILWAADFSVCIFFVMSALVLCLFYDTEGLSFTAACVRRYFRLTVPIFGASAIAYILWSTVGMHNLAAQAITQEGWLKSFYLSRPHLAAAAVEPFYQIYITPTSVLDPPLWTMKYELWGSIGVFLFSEILRNRWLRLMALALAVVFTFKSYYVCFVGGVLLYEWSRLPEAEREKVPSFAKWTLLLAGAYMGAFPFNVGGPDNRWFGWMGFLTPENWHALGAIPFVFGIISIPALRAVLTTRVPRYLGKISFSLYLIHVPIIGSLTTWLIVHSYTPPNRFRAMLIAVAITVPVVIVCSHLFEKLVDAPAIRFSRWSGKFADYWFRMRETDTRTLAEQANSASMPTP